MSAICRFALKMVDLMAMGVRSEGCQAENGGRRPGKSNALGFPGHQK
jgi:hypothetical protein